MTPSIDALVPDTSVGAAMKARPSPRLGAQLWLERRDSAQRVERLIEQAAASGLGLLRIFLMWPWMEPTPGRWVFDPFDAAFEAAARHGIRIKATLTANSGPWHIGTPSVLHSLTMTLSSAQRPAMRRYIETCVRRYAGHAALGQWIIWNEPRNPVVAPGKPNLGRSDEQRERWTGLLTEHYGGDVQALNVRWRTGYDSFARAPFPEDIPHRVHRGDLWQSFGPWLDEWRLRATVLRDELAWVADLVRGVDPNTPLCFNPPDCLENHAFSGYDWAQLAAVPDVLGASVHAPVHLAFTPQETHTALLVAAVTFLAQIPGDHGVELTEMQVGNTYSSAPRPRDASPAVVASSYLAPLLAGAQSVTGWSLNTRQQDFEAGDWGLFDDTDRVGDRAFAARQVRDVLAELQQQTHGWTARTAEVLVLTSEESQAVQLVQSWWLPELPGRCVDDAIKGSALLTVELLRLGVSAALCPVAGLTRAGASPRVLLVSHLGAWSPASADQLLRLAQSGTTVVIDGISGRQDLDARLHRPWPGGLTEQLGLRATGLHTVPAGQPLRLYGADAGRFPLVTASFEFTDPAWRALEEPRLGPDGGACGWERPLGRGRVVVVAGSLAAAAVHSPRSWPAIRHILRGATRDLHPPVRPLSPDTITVPVSGHTLDAVGVFAPAIADRGGSSLRVALPPGKYIDAWNQTSVEVGYEREAAMLAPDGIALLIGPALAAQVADEQP